MVADPYSRANNRCGNRRAEAFLLQGQPYCTRCGRTVRKHYKKIKSWGEERYREVWVHTGPIFSTSAGC